MNGTNGRAFSPLGDMEAFLRAVSLPVAIAEKPARPPGLEKSDLEYSAIAKPKRSRAPKKKHIPIAPAGMVPSGEVEWIAVKRGFENEQKRVKAQTWFFARAAALALFMCEASEVVVVRA